MLTAAQVRYYFDYHPETGEMFWRNPTSDKVKAGDRAGADRGDGYYTVGVNYGQYLVHRIAWLYVHGQFPEMFLDHINRNPSDNRIVNLREATCSQNFCNKKSASGYKGVRFSKGAYQADIKFNKKRYYLGRYKTPEEAYAAYVAKAKELHGEFCSE